MPRPGVEQVLITERLWQRRLRPANPGGEMRAFAELARETARTPQRVPQKLTRAALDLCQGHSAGVSVLLQPPGEYLSWAAVAGTFSPHANVVTPRNFSPCGTALDAGAAQLFHCPGRYFTYLNGLAAPVVELLVVPIQGEHRALGTLWVATHEPLQPGDPDELRFDAVDAHIMSGLTRFAGVALQWAPDDADTAR